MKHSHLIDVREDYLQTKPKKTSLIKPKYKVFLLPYYSGEPAVFNLLQVPSRKVLPDKICVAAGLLSRYFL